MADTCLHFTPDRVQTGWRREGHRIGLFEIFSYQLNLKRNFLKGRNIQVAVDFILLVMLEIIDADWTVKQSFEMSVTIMEIVR